MQDVTVVADRAPMRRFQEASSGWNKVRQLTSSVEAPRTKGLIAAFHVIRAVAKNQLALGNALELIKLFTKTHVLNSECVVRHPQFYKVLLELRNFFLELLPLKRCCEAVQSRGFRNDTVNNIRHVYRYSMTRRTGQ